jgi:hypothetical protein
MANNQYLHKMDMFWLCNYPFGMVDVNIADMIHVDNQSLGKCVSWEPLSL